MNYRPGEIEHDARYGGSNSAERKLVFAIFKLFSGEAKIIILAATDFFCSVLEEHDESSRIPACTWVCALSFGRCRMSKFWLLVYLDFYGALPTG